MSGGDRLHARDASCFPRRWSSALCARARNLLGAALLCSAQASSQAADVSHQLTPYLWGAGLTGVVGAGGIVTDVDASFSDIVSNLDMGFMATYRADIDDWLLVADGMYIGLGGRGHSPNGLVESRVDVDQTVVEFDVGRKVTAGVALVAGARYVDMTSESTSRGPLGNAVTLRADADWVDPIVGVIASTDVGANGSATLRADIGGFGVGAELAWQLVGALAYRVIPGLSVVAAYRHLDMDYDSGNGADRFRFDAAMSGPAFGITFQWK
jgi:hypothetical protein